MKILKKLRGAFVFLAVLFAASASWSAFRSGQNDPVLENAQDKLAGLGRAVGPQTDEARGGVTRAGKSLLSRISTFDFKGVHVSPSLAPLLWLALGATLFFIVWSVSSKSNNKGARTKGRSR